MLLLLQAAILCFSEHLGHAQVTGHVTIVLNQCHALKVENTPMSCYCKRGACCPSCILGAHCCACTAAQGACCQSCTKLLSTGPCFWYFAICMYLYPSLSVRDFILQGCAALVNKSLSSHCICLKHHAWHLLKLYVQSCYAED